MTSAAFLPDATASMTVLGPVTRSPPAKTPFMLVSRVFLSAFTLPPLSTSSPMDARGPLPGLSPMATMSVSRSTLNSLPGTGTGVRLPVASTSPRRFLTHSMPIRRPSLA